MVRGASTCPPHPVSDHAIAHHTIRLRQRIHQAATLGRPAGGGQPDQEIAVEVDGPALAGLVFGKPLQIVPGDGVKTALVPAVERVIRWRAKLPMMASVSIISKTGAQQ